MREFIDEDLRGAVFRGGDLSGARFLGVNLDRVVMRGGSLVDVEITGMVRNVTINGVEVVGLIMAELDRRDPERVLMRPTDVDGFRAAWDLVERRWAETVERARGLDPLLLHESVGGEWSFIQTLRHLVFNNNLWVRRAMLGETAPWHALDLPADDIPDTPGIPVGQPDARPSLDEVLAPRRDGMARVRAIVDALTEERLDAETAPVILPGESEARGYPVRDCLLVVLDEEWEHRRFAERDLAALG